MKKKIWEMLETPLYVDELSDALGARIPTMEQYLADMEADALVVKTKKGRWARCGELGYIAAKASVSRGGLRFARPVDGSRDYRVPDTSKEIVFEGDTMLIKPDKKRGEGYCEIVRVTKRARDRFAATLVPDGGEFALRFSDPAVDCEASVIDGTLGAQGGDLVLVEPARWPSAGKKMLARVVERLGSAAEVRASLYGIAAEHGFFRAYPEKASREADALPEIVETGADRRDLRGLTLFTIDGDDAQDFDDAVSLAKDGDTWRLGVHIADVSHYVPIGTEIDQEAFARGTSLYLPGLTMPMLPERLCNDLCSLRPDRDRYAFSLLLDPHTGDFELTKSVIRSRARLTYAEVNALYEGRENDVPAELRKTLLDMRALSRTLRDKREKRGAVDFDLPEMAFTLRADGTPSDMRAKERGEAERVIEDFMLLANETVAGMAKNADIPFVYRVHEDPDPERLLALENLFRGLDLKSKLGTKPHPGRLARALDEAEKAGLGMAVRPLALRCMRRARYADEPLGHYALSLADYCHFTSPIRRYPDLMVHRALARYLKDGGALSVDMAGIAAASSKRETEASEAEREGDDLMMCLFMADKVGETFEGTVSGISQGAFFVSLESGAEGCVPFRLMSGNVEANEAGTAVSLARGKTIKLGDRLDVRLTEASVERRELTFVPA